MKYYKEFLVSAEPFIPEVIGSILWTLDIDGINEEVGCLKIYTKEESLVTQEAISAVLERLIKEGLINNYTLEENLYELKNWNEEWEKSLPVIEIDDQIIIKPTFREYEVKDGQIIIEIDPKMSFGTGDHQTTRLVLALLKKYLTKGAKVLDAGSGTGIISILAVKLGASEVTAFDNDEWSYINGLENAELNHTADRIHFFLSEITDIREKEFDIAAANIQKNVLLSIAGELFVRVKPGGTIILSGLLKSDEKDISEKYKSMGCNFIEKQQMDEWIALVFGKE